MTMSKSEALFASYIKRGHFGLLDGLRFICIVMVLWHHSSLRESFDLLLLQRGFLGVDFFFVLSGFLITTLLLREEKRHGDFSLGNFYLRRLIRIVPIYFFVVSSVSFYFIVLKKQYELIELLPFYYLFLSNFLIDHIPLLTITWSLSVEEQYYLLWPLLLLILPRYLIIPALIVFIIVNVLSGVGVILGGAFEIWPLAIGMPNSTYAPILLGSLSAILLNSKKTFLVFASFLNQRFAALFVLCVLVGLMYFLPPDIRGLPNLAIHIFMTIFIMSIVINEENILSFILKNKLIARVGMVSYGIYLYHLIALDISTRTFSHLGLENNWLILIGYVLMSWLMAEVSFRTLERFFQRFKPYRSSQS